MSAVEILQTQNSVRQVEQFVTRVWEHSLLTSETRQFRKTALEELASIAENVDVGQEEYVGIPVGSFRWIPNKMSDYDYLLIAIGGKALFFNSIDARTNYMIGKCQLHVVNSCRGVLSRPTGDIGTQLLLTPDDYIAGNIPAARNLRLSTIQRMRDLVTEDAWESEGGIFNEFIRYWDESSPKRAMRYHSALQQRANQTHNPRKWMEQFENAKNNLQLPSFEVYYDALQQTEGALHINPRFVAQGIS